MKFYSYYRSSASFRVRIALALKNIDHESTFIDLKRGLQAGSFSAISVQEMVPVIEEGDLRIGQSLAIIEYLDELNPSPPLLPVDTAERAVVRSMAQLIACDIHPLNNLRVLKYLKREFKVTQVEIVCWYAHWIAKGFTALEQLVRLHGSASHCFGDRVSLADICLVPQIWNARSMDIALDDYPRLLSIGDSLAAIPAFRDSRPEAQPDAV